MSNQNKNLFIIEIYHDGKKTTFLEKPETYNDLMEKIFIHLGFFQSNQLISSLSYIDEDGDKISVNNNEDYLESLKNASDKNNNVISYNITSSGFSINDWELINTKSILYNVDVDPLSESIILNDIKVENVIKEEKDRKSVV